MVTVGLVSAGFMGSGLGGALRQGGARVVTTVEGRSARTARLAAEAGLELLPTLTDVVAVADVVLSVTPPGAAVATAEAIAAAARGAGAAPAAATRGDRQVGPRSDRHVDDRGDERGDPRGGRPVDARSDRHVDRRGGRQVVARSDRYVDRRGGRPVDARGDQQFSPRGDGQVDAGGDQRFAALDGWPTGGGLIVADLNAVSPETMERVAEVLAGVRVVDGSISGPPPSVRPGARLYLSGADADVVAALPWGGAVEAIVLGGRVGTASALKMCTGSVYKGLTALVTQAMRTADSFGVVDAVVGDLERNGLADSAGVARSATKAHRFVDEMREVAATQRAAGLTPELFEAVADVYAEIARSRLAQDDPENDRDLSPAEIVARLRG